MSWNGTQLKHFKNLVDDLQTNFNDMLPIISAMQAAIEGMGGDLGDIETWQNTVNDSLANIQNKLSGINIKVGTYRANEPGSLDIPLGFTPNIVLILNVSGTSLIAYKSPAFEIGYMFMERKILGYGEGNTAIRGLDMVRKTDNNFVINGQTVTVTGTLYELAETYAYIAL